MNVFETESSTLNSSLASSRPNLAHHAELSRESRWIAEIVVVLYVAAVTEAVRYFGIPYLLFPELGALAYDVLVRPWGKWASQPVRLIVTPAVTALLGTLVTRHFAFNGLTTLLVVAASAAVIAAMRSWITPAMSAGVLPLVLGVKSWWYPVSMVATLVVLSLMAWFWKKQHSGSRGVAGTSSGDVEDVLESAPRGRWMPVFFVFVVVMAEASRLTGLRFMMFPPLVTMAYEMFGHAESCAWTKRSITFPVSCFLMALSGTLAYRLFGQGTAMAAITVVIGVGVLRAFRLHMPPAMAVGLLPAVMASPTMKFPFAVLAATVSLTLAFLGYRRLERVRGVSVLPSRP